MQLTKHFQEQLLPALLLAVLSLLFFGGESLFSFSVAMTIGIIVGTYSSIYIDGALAVVLGLENKIQLYHKKGTKHAYQTVVTLLQTAGKTVYQTMDRIDRKRATKTRYNLNINCSKH